MNDSIEKTKLYIDGPENEWQEGVYYLVTAEGEMLATHYCSNLSFAWGDLEKNRPERQKEFKERFGDYEVVRATEEESKELQRKNREESIRRKNLRNIPEEPTNE